MVRCRGAGVDLKDAGRDARQRVALLPRRGAPGDRPARRAVELRRRWRVLPSGVRGPAHPSCASVRPAARGAHLAGRAAVAPDYRCL